jgi:hypothetical protein
LDEVKEEVGPIRRSARLASKREVRVVGAGGGGTTAARTRRRVRQWVTRYFVKWKGFGEEEVTREQATNLRLHVQDAIDEYEYRQAQERGEEVVGVHYMHTMKEEEGGVTLHSVTVVVSRTW